MSREQMMLKSAPSAAAASGGGGGGETLMTKTNTITPCAACRLLRRRCAPECPFSPYFSPNEPHKFACVHKVFGASNVSKMLMEVPEDQRADTADSLVYEATLRLKDPVYGCVGAISVLQHQVQCLETELNAVRAEILRYKLRNARIMAPPSPPTHESINVPISRPFSMDAPPSAPPLPPSLPPAAYSGLSVFTHANTSSSQYSTVSGKNLAYFG
ncbi:LOB domain-containing protein 15-like [Punica granatum]|nr:LOB domain-containing protein 15-like [Punica granatum]